jgi:hypothetical protein
MVKFHQVLLWSHLKECVGLFLLSRSFLYLAYDRTIVWWSTAELMFLFVHLFFSPLSNSGLKFIFAKPFHQVFLFDFLVA